MRCKGPRFASAKYEVQTAAGQVYIIMCRAAGIRPESCLSHREGAKVSDFKNVSRCSKVKVKLE